MDEYMIEEGEAETGPFMIFEQLNQLMPHNVLATLFGGEGVRDRIAILVYDAAILSRPGGVPVWGGDAARAMAGASVAVRGPGANYTKRASSGGYAEFPNLTRGVPYTVVVSKPGYRTRSATIRAARYAPVTRVYMYKR